MERDTDARMDEWIARLVIVEGGRTRSITLYNDYVRWTRDAGRRPMTRNMWGRWMYPRFPRGRDRGMTAYLGVELPPKVKKEAQVSG